MSFFKSHNYYKWDHIVQPELRYCVEEFTCNVGIDPAENSDVVGGSWLVYGFKYSDGTIETVTVKNVKH